jgi:two-component system, response regulator PdtaR
LEIEMPLRILIADDYEPIRSAMTRLFRTAGWEVCGSVGDGEEAIKKAVELKPDLLILDFLMPQCDGISAAREIRAKLPDVPVVLYTMFSSASIESEAKKLGIRAVVQKASGRGLISTIQRALAQQPS